MTVLITLTAAGSDTGPFDIYSDVDGFTSAFEVGVLKTSLLSGYTSSLVPDNTTIVRVKSTSVYCKNQVDITLGTPAPACKQYIIEPGGPNCFINYTDCLGNHVRGSQITGVTTLCTLENTIVSTGDPLSIVDTGLCP